MFGVNNQVHRGQVVVIDVEHVVIRDYILEVFINEPIADYCLFVMNTKEEVYQTL